MLFLFRSCRLICLKIFYLNWSLKRYVHWIEFETKHEQFSSIFMLKICLLAYKPFWWSSEWSCKCFMFTDVFFSNIILGCHELIKLKFLELMIFKLLATWFHFKLIAFFFVPIVFKNQVTQIIFAMSPIIFHIEVLSVVIRTTWKIFQKLSQLRGNKKRVSRLIREGDEFFRGLFQRFPWNMFFLLLLFFFFFWKKKLFFSKIFFFRRSFFFEKKDLPNFLLVSNTY